MNTENKNVAIDTDKSRRVGTLLEGILKENGIPSRPAILDRIHVEMDKEEPDLNLLSLIVSADVALAGGLISIANSPYFGFHGRVRSVNEALIVLGLDVACRGIAGLILRKLFPVTLPLERFWDASASIARLSGWLAQHEDLDLEVAASDAYTFGLFRDCGIAVLLHRFPYYHEVLLQANAEKTLNFTQVEEMQCPTNHTIIGNLLAQSWWLPEEICTGIRVHHDYTILQKDDATELPKSTREMIVIAQFAEHIYQHHTNLSKSQEWEKSKEACMERLGISEDKLAHFYEDSAPVLAKF
jgi:HD-like signal output (HDOD) protein